MKVLYANPKHATNRTTLVQIGAEAPAVRMSDKQTKGLKLDFAVPGASPHPAIPPTAPAFRTKTNLRKGVDEIILRIGAMTLCNDAWARPQCHCCRNHNAGECILRVHKSHRMILTRPPQGGCTSQTNMRCWSKTQSDTGIRKKKPPL